MGNAQSVDELWSKKTNSKASSANKIEEKTMPSNFDVYQLNAKLLKKKLQKAPKRVDKLKKSSTIISFPNEKGELETYRVFEASIMEESLQKQFPNIRSYVGESIDNPGSIIRFSETTLGLHAMILHKSGGTTFIDPYKFKESSSYMVYSKKNLPIRDQFECRVIEPFVDAKLETSTVNAKSDNANDGKLRTFRLAIATTGEYSQFHLTNQNISASATDAVKKAAVLSAIVTSMTRVNAIFERDVALTMVLVANNTNIIFLDAATDGFTNNDGNLLIDESQTVIDANIGFSNYDIGHTFSTGGGGYAQLNSPCTGSKARGITGSSNPIGDAYDIDYVIHEMGHQFGAHHTFNGDAGNCGGGNRWNSTAVEPGSGSTIMAYAGICAPQNVQSNSDAYFHLVSIREMWANITAGNSTCGVQSTTSNTAPTIVGLNNYTIPISTPFVLNANATDLNGDNLTFTWEQLDASGVTNYPLTSTATTGPVFRSISPNASSMRYFPDQNTVIAGNLASVWEVLPSVARSMKFGVNVRDNNINVGQTASAETNLTVDASSGPFLVTSQSIPEIWTEGITKTITWNVANTNSAPINCSNVNILLSRDGGYTFPIVLASNVPNDGTQDIIVPNKPTVNGRIKIESVGNIFYTMNNANITVQALSYNFTIETIGETCAGKNNGQIKITALEAFNYTTTINGVNYSFTSNVSTPANLPPGVYNNICISVTGQTYQQCYNINVAAGASAKGTASVTSNKVNVEMKEGTTPFTILINGTKQFETNNAEFSVEVKNGDVLDVETSVACEGVFSKTIDLFESIVAYPNPTKGNFEIAVPNATQKEVTIELYTIQSQLISIKTYPIQFGKVQLNIENKPTGLYIAKLNLDSPVTLKIIKQ